MKEVWRELKVQKIPNGQYEVVECVQNKEGTRIILESVTHHLTILFGFVDALRICDEGRRIRTYNEIVELQNYRKDFVGNPIYLVDNSEFIEWIFIESSGFCRNVKHYAIVTLNDIIDVISSDKIVITIDKIR